MLKKIAMGVILFIYIILLFFSACTSLTKKQPHISHVRLMDKMLDSFISKCGGKLILFNSIYDYIEDKDYFNFFNLYTNVFFF